MAVEIAAKMLRRGIADALLQAHHLHILGHHVDDEVGGQAVHPSPYFNNIVNEYHIILHFPYQMLLLSISSIYFLLYGLVKSSGMESLS